MTKISFLLRLLVATIIFGGCTFDPEKLKNTTTTDTVKKTPADYSLFDYKLPESNYNYKIKITGIDTKLAKDAFTTKADNYAIPQKVDGYYLTIMFSMTNPYDKEMMAPVPYYYYITSSNDEWFSGSTTFHKACQCDIDNSTEVTTDKGEELYSITEGKCGYSDYCVRFQPNETKNFIINFTDPIFGKVRRLVFWGFGRHWKNSEYIYDRDLGLGIDVDKKVVTGDKRF